ncbi:MAG: glycosyltransferase [Leptospirales bacterium]|nr:glycosyltransferase [Leptospirales bacterium]
MIAAAGKGTRAYPRTSFVPKPLFTFEGQSILERNVALMFETLKVKRLYIIVGHLQEQVLAEVARIRQLYPGRQIETAQWTQQGLAADVASLRDRISGDFALVLGDEFYWDTNHQEMARVWKRQTRARALIAILRTSLLSDIRKNYSVELSGSRVQELIEKPEDPPNDLLGLGSYVFSRDYFDFFDSTPPASRSGVVELTQVIHRMAHQSDVRAALLKGRYFNINSLADYYAATYSIRSEKFNRYRISLIMPAFNNEATIADAVHNFKNQVHETLVLDMGSTDRTAQIAARAGARVVRNAPPESMASAHYAPAIYAAMRAARGDILVLATADGAFRAGDLGKLLEYLKDCDMAAGTRTTRQLIEQGSNLSPFYRWLNVFFGKLVEAMWWAQEPRLTDIGCIYRAIWKESFLRVASGLQAQDRTYCLEMVVEIMRFHMRCIEAPVSYYRRYGQAPDESWPEKWRYFMSVLRLILRKRLQRS